MATIERIGQLAIALGVGLAVISFFALLLLFPSMVGAQQSALFAGQPVSRPALLPTTQGSVPVAGAPTEYTLALPSSRMEVENGRATFSGSVQNLGDRPLGDVMVAIILYDQNRVERARADALIEETLLRPGQLSPWRVTMKNHPELPLYGVEFLQWHVGALSTRDDREP